jgi:hypothetical protein
VKEVLDFESPIQGLIDLLGGSDFRRLNLHMPEQLFDHWHSLSSSHERVPQVMDANVLCR